MRARVRARACLVGALVLVGLPGVGSAVALGQGGAEEVRHPAKLEVARNTIDRGNRRLDVLAPITKRASGEVRVELHAAGKRYRFGADVNSEKGYVRFRRVIPRDQAELGTGIVTIAYPGNARTRGQEVRLRAANRKAGLDAQRPELQAVGGQLRLRSQGELSGRARGVVRVQLDWVDAAGANQSYETNAKIDDGRWRLSEALPGEVRESVEGRRSTVHSYTLFTGYLRARMRGEMEAYQVLPAPPPAVLAPFVGPIPVPAQAAPPPPASSPPPQEPEAREVPSDNVQVVPPPGEAGEVRVDGEVPGLEAGDYLATGIGPASPFGFLGEVTAVRREGGDTIFSTQPAKLIDAVPEGQIDVAFEARADTAGSFRTQGAGTVSQPISKRVSCTTGGSVEITGSLALDPSFSFQARWTRDRGVQDARFTGSVRADAELAATAQAASSCRLERTALLARPITLRPVSVQVGPIPVVLVPVVQLYASAEGTIQASVTTAVRGSMTATGGLSYQNGAYSPIASREVSFTHDAPTMDQEAGLEARVGPTLNLLLYGVGGPELSLTTGLKLQASPADNPWWTLTSPLRLDAALTVPALNLSSGTLNALDIEIPIADAGGPHPNPLGGGDPGSGATERVSVSSAGEQGNNIASDLFAPSVSADGRFVAFESYASNLVAGDTNTTFDVFVHDRSTGATERVSVSSTGGQADRDSRLPSMSADGRFVAFESYASNLVAGETNGTYNVFVRDRWAGTNDRVTASNSPSVNASLSADGRFVAFESEASDLVSGDTNGLNDVFVHDRSTGTNERVSVSSAGEQAKDNPINLQAEPSLSADGRFVAFKSSASNLVAGDTNSDADVFVHDRSTGTTERVSVSSDGGQADRNGVYAFPSLSADGRYVAFDSAASNLAAGDTNSDADVFLHDRSTGATERVSVDSVGGQANNASVRPTVSADGRFVSFTSVASNLVAGDTNGTDDVFVHDRATGTTERVSVSSAGQQGDLPSGFQSVSADGRFVAFKSDASNLVAGDTNGAQDVFVRDRGAP